MSKFRPWQRGAAVALAALVTGALAGCSSEAQTAAGSGSSAQTDVQLLLPATVGLNWSAFLVAKEKFWPELGLDGEGVGTDGSSGVLQQLVAGNATYGIAGAAAVYAAVAEGAKLTGIATMTHDDVARLSVSAKDDTIKSPADLQGKAIGITSAGDGSRPIVAAVMKAAGVTDYEEPIVGDGGPAVANAFQTGKIQAFAHGVSDVAGMEVIANFPLRSIMPEEFVGLPGNVFVVPDSALDDPGKKAVAFKLASGWLQAAAWLPDHLDEATEIVCGQAPEACTNPETAKRAVQYASATTEPLGDQLGYTDPQKAQTLITAVVGKTTVPIDTVLTNQYLAEINAGS
jgi:ABC-type nitrate/sulfonate/bicarbonate transport system substrate-binding protein